MPYIDLYSNELGTWKVTDLWEAVKGIKPISIPIAEIFKYNDLDIPVLLKDFERILNADINYPIILSFENQILDGQHRLLRALLEGHSHIYVKYLGKMPPTINSINRIKEV